MNVNGIQQNVQWEEIQRLAQERIAQKKLAALTAKQLAPEMETTHKESSDSFQKSNERMLFTDKATVTQSYLPKGTIFDKLA